VTPKNAESYENINMTLEASPKSQNTTMGETIAITFEAI
jgi:hypothetical protein